MLDAFACCKAANTSPRPFRPFPAYLSSRTVTITQAEPLTVPGTGSTLLLSRFARGVLPAGPSIHWPLNRRT